MNYEYSFEFSPGKFVYLPTPGSKRFGRKINKFLVKRWQPDPIFFHLRRRGGHVTAMRHHTDNQHFARLDLENFFSSVTRTKVSRALASLGLAKKTSFEIARKSVVAMPHAKALPYGFVQSMPLATLALEKSALGNAMIRSRPPNIRLSVYVDDIILSGPSTDEIEHYISVLDTAAATSGFSFSENKRQHPASDITAFNCEIRQGHLQINQDRMNAFKAKIQTATDAELSGIQRYVEAVNTDQLEELLN